MVPRTAPGCRAGGPGWHGFYAIASDGGGSADRRGESILIAGGGTLGPPVDGGVEIGYSVLPPFQRRGYATEMMSAIVAWLCGIPSVSRIWAETADGNAASRAVLAHLGFMEIGPGSEPSTRRFERSAHAE